MDKGTWWEAMDRIQNGLTALDGVLDLVCAASGELSGVKSDGLYTLLRFAHDETSTGADNLPR